METKKLALATAAVVAGSLVASGAYGQAVLTGDKKLACEAVLCLATGSRPSACTPAITKYFSIHMRLWSNTLKARHNFLELCPRDHSDTNMNTLVAAEAAGAGQCDARSLNSLGYYDYDTGAYVIPDTMPGYCAAYVSNPYTYGLAPVYRGVPGIDGQWFDH